MSGFHTFTLCKTDERNELGILGKYITISFSRKVDGKKVYFRKTGLVKSYSMMSHGDEYPFKTATYTVVFMDGERRWYPVNKMKKLIGMNKVNRNYLASKIQKIWRGYKAKKNFNKLKRVLPLGVMYAWSPPFMELLYDKDTPYESIYGVFIKRVNFLPDDPPEFLVRYGINDKEELLGYANIRERAKECSLESLKKK